jgi:transcriptional regulator with XRE-family HTH domain
VTEDDKSLWELFQFSEKDERHRMMADVIGLTLAWQIRAMREARGWTQGEVATRMGTAQSVVCNLENPAYILHSSLSTLLRLANVFDVALIARFTDWKKWCDDMLGAAAFIPPSYSPEQLSQLSQ